MSLSGVDADESMEPVEITSPDDSSVSASVSGALIEPVKNTSPDDSSVSASVSDKSVLSPPQLDDEFESELEDEEKNTNTNQTGHICWLKHYLKYQAKTTEKIRAKHDAVVLFRSIENTNILTLNDAACFRKWLLITATEHNHTELVKLMLADERFAFNAKVNCPFVCAFYVAIEKGHVAVVQEFVLAGGSVTENATETIDLLVDGFKDLPEDWCIQRLRAHDVSCVYEASCVSCHERVSAVEYACLVNQLEVLKLLVAHFNLLHPPTRTRRRTRPIHIIMGLASKYYGRNMDRLPACVQVMIDADGDVVHYVNDNGFTALQVLIRSIRIIAPPNEAGTEYRRIIAEIANVLLTAGADPNAGSSRHYSLTPLGMLEKFIFPMDAFKFPILIKACEPLRPVDLVISDHFQLVNELARQLLLYKAYFAQLSFFERILIFASRWMQSRVITWTAENYTGMMDGYCNLYRMGVLAGADCITDAHWNHFIDQRNFIESFSMLANFTVTYYEEGESFLRMILNTFSERNVEKLKGALKVRIRDAETDASQFPPMFSNLNDGGVFAKDALKFVESVDTSNRRSLQYLTCSVINRRMASRALKFEDGENLGLGLPSRLLSMILFQ